MVRSLFLACLVSASSALAQTPGECAVGTARATLDAGGVEAVIPNTGTLFYGPGFAAAYVVPKESGLSPMYAANLWVGGRVGGEVRVAGTTYGFVGGEGDAYEFWPGPLDEGATLPDPDDCSAYDRIWVVSAEDLARYERTGTPTLDMVEWPVGLGAPAIDTDGTEIVPTSRDQTLDLAAGERPVIYGSQAAFWVMNDVGNEHRTTGSAPLGIEVAASAFAIASDEAALNQATFYRYRITNRNSQPIEDTYISVWADPDLGNAADDYVGVDTTRSMVFVYNADEVDDGEYGTPPAFGVDLLGGDGNGPSSAVYMIKTPFQGVPLTVEGYHNVMRGLWRDGMPITAFGNGYNQGGDVTRFAMTGDPVAKAFWSEENAGNGRNVPGDRRFVLSTGPGALAPGETRTIDLALVFAQGADRLDSIVELRAASDHIQAAYDADALFQLVPVVLPPLPPPPILDVALVVGPNPAAGRTTAYVRLPEAAPARLRLFDALGRVVLDLNSRQWPAGETPVEIDTARLAAGVYTAVLDVRGGPSLRRRVTVVR